MLFLKLYHFNKESAENIYMNTQRYFYIIIINTKKVDTNISIFLFFITQ